MSFPLFGIPDWRKSGSSFIPGGGGDVGEGSQTPLTAEVYDLDPFEISAAVENAEGEVIIIAVQVVGIIDAGQFMEVAVFCNTGVAPSELVALQRVTRSDVENDSVSMMFVFVVPAGYKWWIANNGSALVSVDGDNGAYFMYKLS
jgi:hypothetical protein